ncbi:autotransporter outer membrane beta-barrel domain-containing protein [Myroides guanonis]|uniref:Collagen triple helix repeat-containing protein n=1 Tax=Myroides guanonis TaxID=1150112 RepID=A0A1I3L5R3_9FLAO|nr:hypothetical protein [Myroides guanonis]SFI80082.1 hypothetical protein SAMN04487893_101189 [Myroides guanonis]
MNKRILNISTLVAVLAFCAQNATAQQGFGTNQPSKASVIEMKSESKGLLIPRVTLTSAIEFGPITGGSITGVSAETNSLLVYNIGTSEAGIADVNKVIPGYYYWTTANQRWNRLVADNDTSALTLVGDVTGSIGNNSVVKIQGRDVSNTAPTSNQVLAWNGTAWEPTTISTTQIGNGQDVSAASNKVALGGTPVGAALKAFSIDVNEGNLTLSNIGGKVLTSQITQGTANQVLVTSTDGTTTNWVDQTAIVPETTNVLESSENALASTVNGKKDTTTIINSVGNSIDTDGKLVTTVNGVKGDGLDLTEVIQAEQLRTVVAEGTGIKVVGPVPDNTANTITYTVSADPSTIALAGDVTGNAGATKVEGIQGTPVSGVSPTTDGQTLVYDSTSRKWIVGTPNVDAGDVLNAKDLLGADGLDATIEVVSGGTKSLLVETSLRVKEESITTAHIQNGTIGVVDIAEAGTNQVLVTGSDNKPVWKDQSKVSPKFFYMPAVIFDTSVQGTTTRDLYQEYVNQFTGGAVGSTNAPYNISHGPAGTTPLQYAGGIVGSTGAPSDITVFAKGDLYYYVTYFDEAVFENLSIDIDGKLKYTVKAGATPSSYMNIVFVIK